jgi:hypothetical protein
VDWNHGSDPLLIDAPAHDAGSAKAIAEGADDDPDDAGGARHLRTSTRRRAHGSRILMRRQKEVNRACR